MATDKHLAIIDQISLHREDAKRAAFRLAMAMAERASVRCLWRNFRPRLYPGALIERDLRVDPDHDHIIRGHIRRSKRRKAIEEPPTGGFSHFQTPSNAPIEKPRHGDRGVMFGAPLVLHGQDQDEKSPFIGSGFFSR